MASTNGVITLKNIETGQLRTVSFYNAANGAAGTFLPCEISGQLATTNSDTTFELPANYIVQDLTSDAATGVIEIVMNGLPVGMAIDYAAQQKANAGRAIPLGYQVVAGQRYKLRVVSALSA